MSRKRRSTLFVGVGFVTGRSSFKNVIRTYIQNWNESGLSERHNVRINLFVAYDLKYNNTRRNDYLIQDDLILDQLDSAYYIGQSAVQAEIDDLMAKRVLSQRQARLLFGEGYAQKRNAVQYFALKHGMDMLVFFDDDEYPMACQNVDGQLYWKGQQVLATHLRHLPDADMTHGHHCGYVSPIPAVTFSSEFTEEDFRHFIEAVSNDILDWDSMKEKIRNGGVTYADPEILHQHKVWEVPEEQGMKFISGANLGINLRRPEQLYPFFNPPGARGEDTFLSTCLRDYRVLKVPCYTFHDGFGAYPHMLDGVLPSVLRPIRSRADRIATRFLRAAVGWVRYKPLLQYLTDPEGYEARIVTVRKNLEACAARLGTYFNDNRFQRLPTELDKYHERVPRDARRFEESKDAWMRVVRHFRS